MTKTDPPLLTSLCVPTIGEDKDATGALIRSAIERPGGSYMDEVVLAFPAGVTPDIPGVQWASEWRGTTYRDTPVVGVVDQGALDGTSLWTQAFRHARGMWCSPGIPGTVFDLASSGDDPRAVSLHDFLRGLPDDVTDLWGPLTFSPVAPGVPAHTLRAPVFVRWKAGFVWSPPPNVMLLPTGRGVSGEHPGLSRHSDVAVTFAPVPTVWAESVPSLVTLLRSARMSLGAGDALAALEHALWATVIDAAHPGGYFEAGVALVALREHATAETLLRKGLDRTRNGLPVRAMAHYQPNVPWFLWLIAQIALGAGNREECLGLLRAATALMPWRCVVDQIAEILHDGTPR